MIDSLTATPSSVPPGGTVTIAVAAHDPDCTTGTCTTGCGLYVNASLTVWTPSGGTITAVRNGVSGSPYAAEADWQVPTTEGNYTLRVTVADSGTFMCGGRKSVAGTLPIQVTTILNQPPVIGSATASPAQLFPGQTSALACAASDPENDPVSYLWTTDRGTVVAGAEPGAATFSSDSPGIASATCTATDSLGAMVSRSVAIAISAAHAERSLAAGLSTPERLAIDGQGRIWVADRKRGGLVAISLESGETVVELPLDDVTSVDVDWSDRLLVAAGGRVELRTTSGLLTLTLEAAEPLGAVADVAVDHFQQRYLALFRDTARVVVWDATGQAVTEFGSRGGGAEELRMPSGLAVAPNGNVVIADAGQGLIKVFSPSGQLVLSFGGRGGGAGKFVQLADVAVAPNGVIYASDSFQSWIQSFYADGTPREAFGGYGEGAGRFKTPIGLAFSSAFSVLAAASLNSGRVELYRIQDSGETPTAGAVASPATLTFAATAVGEGSAPQTVSLRNVGTAPLLVSTVAIVGDFTQSHACPPTLEPDASCDLEVRSMPSVQGASVGNLRIATNAPGNEWLSVPLAGSGFVRPTATLAPTRVEFAALRVGEVSEPVTVTFSNTSAQALSVLDLSLTGEFAAQTDCTVILAPGASCAIAVSFVPQLGVGTVVGQLTLTSDAAGSPHVAELIALGLEEFPQLRIRDVELAEGDEGTSSARFPVTLSAPVSTTVTVDYATVANSAEPSRDYQHTTGTLVFAPGTTALEVAVPVVGDRVLEAEEETFFVQLSNPVGATIFDSRVTGTVTDDELCPSRTLVADGDAEQFPVDGAIASWQEAAGFNWQRRFADPVPESTLGGKAYFWPGRVEAAELRQQIDVRAFRGSIRAGRQRFGFWGLVLTRGADQGAIRVEYLDAYGNVLEAFDSGDLMSASAWMEVADDRYAPTETDWIRVRLFGWRVDTDRELDVFFDALAVHSLRTATVEIVESAYYEGGDGVPQQVAIPIRLACEVEQDVRGLVRTRDFRATAGEDYAAVAEFFTLSAGTVETSVPMTIHGDALDEPHEDLGASIELVQPTEALLLGGEKTLRILNDDACAKPLGEWSRVTSYPVGYLTLGGVDYAAPDLRTLLTASAPDLATRVAQQLAATKLNLAIGTPPGILDLVAEADGFLAAHPPGSLLNRLDSSTARRLERDLSTYNGQVCVSADAEGQGD